MAGYGYNRDEVTASSSSSSDEGTPAPSSADKSEPTTPGTKSTDSSGESGSDSIDLIWIGAAGVASAALLIVGLILARKGLRKGRATTKASKAAVKDAGDADGETKHEPS